MHIDSDSTDIQPFIKTSQLVELQEAVVWSAMDLDRKIARVPHPVPPELILPKHWLDGAGTTLGMSGEEIHIYIEAAAEQLVDNELLATKFREFIMIAKLVGGPQVEEKLQALAERRQVLLERQLRADSDYRKKMREYNEKITALQINHERVRQAIFRKWRKIVKSLVALKRKYPDLAHLHPNDVKLLWILEGKGKVEIIDNVVNWVNEDGLLDFSFDEIQEVIHQFPQYDLTDPPF